MFGSRCFQIQFRHEQVDVGPDDMEDAVMISTSKTLSIFTLVMLIKDDITTNITSVVLLSADLMARGAIVDSIAFSGPMYVFPQIDLKELKKIAFAKKWLEERLFTT
ncbi:hypothetical protein ACJMK2_014667 [Sinanodonta woodiana]|uniref:Uncharacterized protein n=1 Tax=Sinanodonta woodiana TaxID=1069815 RepID=A0ABD3V1C5_SINWO